MSSKSFPRLLRGCRTRCRQQLAVRLHTMREWRRLGGEPAGTGASSTADICAISASTVPMSFEELNGSPSAEGNDADDIAKAGFQSPCRPG